MALPGVYAVHAALGLHQAVVDAAGGHQLGVGAELSDAAFVEHQTKVCATYTIE